MRRPSRWLLLAGMLTAIVLAAGSAVGLAAASGAFRGRAASGTRTPAGLPASGLRCAEACRRGGGRDPGRHGWGHDGGPGGPGSMMGGSGGLSRGMAQVLARPGVVAAGTVSLRVVNQGAAAHELVVLPLPAGQAAGARAVGTDGRVDETGSLGEASRSCGAGAGDGIAAGATGWVTLTLQAGRYELVCNLPGHYAAGMYAELDVT